MLKELQEADLAMAPRDAKDAGDIHLRIRGEVAQLGKMIQRKFPTHSSQRTGPENSSRTKRSFGNGRMDHKP